MWHALTRKMLRCLSWPHDAVQTPEMTIGGSPILPEDDVGLYGRSVTFVPESPSLPANFR